MIFCSVCFGDPTAPMTQAYNYGILTLLGVITVVLVCFGVLFLNIRKRTIKNQNFLIEKGLV